MTSFERSYVELYDAFYATKNYDEELKNLNFVISKNGYTLEGKRILEIGCGSGNFTNLLAKQANVEAIDINQDMIYLAQRKFPSITSNFRCIKMNELASSNIEKFDAILLLFHVFSYLSKSEMQDLTALCNKFLRSNGLLIFDYWDLSAVDVERPHPTCKRIEFNGQLVLRVASTTSLQRERNLEKFEVKFDFFKEFPRSYEFLFSERHFLYAHSSESIDKQMDSFSCIANWDIIKGDKFEMKHYGNTKIFVKFREEIGKPSD